MKTTEDDDYVRQTLWQAMPDDLPAAVAERLQEQLAALGRRFDAEPAVAGVQSARGRRRKRLIAWMTAAVATTILLAAVLLAPPAWYPTQSLAWADVVQATAKRPWLHYVDAWEDGTKKEGWYSAGRAVEGTHYMPSGADHGVEHYTWADFAQERVTQYFPQANRIVHGTQSKRYWEDRKFFSEAWHTAFLSGAMEASVRAGGYEIVDQQQREVREGGKRCIEYRFRWRQTDKEMSSQTQFAVLVDPSTRLPFRLDLIAPDQNARPFSRIDYPNSGPADIYAMGVPKNAEVVDCSVRPEVERLAKGTVAAGLRDDIEFSALIVRSSQGHHWGYRVWKKGLRWKIDQTIDSLASSSQEANSADWWRQQAEKASFTPHAVFDGKSHWQYKTKTRRPSQAEIAAGMAKHARVLVSSEKERMLPWPRDYYWEEAPLCHMGHPTTLDDSPPSGLPVYGSAFESPLLAAIVPEAKDGPPNTVLLELRNPIWKLRDARLWAEPQLLRFWIDPQRDHLVMRCDQVISRNGKEQRIGGFLIEGLTQGPKKQWFPTVAHQFVHILPPDSQKDLEDITLRFYYDFTTPLSDSLFKAE